MFFLHENTKLALVYVFLLAWFGLMTWVLAWPLTWASVPILLCFGYLVYRFVFELTFNRANVPTLATCFVARQKIAKIVEKEASKHDQETFAIVDLGSGRGELARCIAKRIPKAIVTGIEMAHFPFWQASFIQRWLGPKNLSYERRDFWELDCSKVNAVILYLGPLTAQRMGEKLHREMKQDSMVISHTYPLLGAWKPIDVLDFHAPFHEVFYVYRKG